MLRLRDLFRQKGAQLIGIVTKGGWGHDLSKRRREQAAADTYAAEGGLGREGANVPVGASGEDGQSKRCPPFSVLVDADYDGIDLGM